MFFGVFVLTKKGGKAFHLYEAKDTYELITKLQQYSLVPLKIIRLPAFTVWLFSIFKPSVKTEEIVEIIDNLHLIVNSGLPIHSGLSDIAADSENPTLKKMLVNIASSIAEGNSLSASCEPYKKYFTDSIINLMRIGEETGQLPETLKRGAEFLRRVDGLKKKAKQALIYPSFAFGAIMIAMLIWIIFVLPQITQVFKDMGIELPPITVALIKVSDFLKEYWYYIIIFTIFLIIAFKISYAKYRKFRLFVTKRLMNIPFLAKMIQGFNIAYISEYLSLSISSGLPLFEAVKTIQKNITNELFKEGMRDSLESLLQGRQLSYSFKQTRLFPSFPVRMIAMGEEAGSLDQQLRIIAKYYYEKVDYYSQNIAKMIEPLVIILVGGFMAILMIGLMGPIYDLISQVK
jgi:type II secretory pathway component PulF